MGSGTRIPHTATPLKTTLSERGYTVAWLSRQTGINRPRLSDIVNGRGIPTDVERKRITRKLRVTDADLGWDGEAEAA